MSEEKTREGGVETVGRKWREADCRWEEETGKKSGQAWVTADCKVDPSSMKYSGQQERYGKGMETTYLKREMVLNTENTTKKKEKKKNKIDNSNYSIITPDMSRKDDKS